MGVVQGKRQGMQSMNERIAAGGTKVWSVLTGSYGQSGTGKVSTKRQ